MKKQKELLLNSVIHGENFFTQKKVAEAKFAQFFRIFQKRDNALEILSVHGDMAFNMQLSASVPETATFIRLSQRLRDYRSKARFGLVFYALSLATEANVNTILEDLCYCRILLRPGGFLFIPTEKNRSRCVIKRFTGQQSKESLWLRQAGFMKIRTQRVKNKVIFVGGQRPLQKF